MKAVVTLSGGLDSSTLAYACQELGYEVHPISFNYGQRHVRELDFACSIADNLRPDDWSKVSHGDFHKIVDLWKSGITDLFKDSGSSLITGNDVPEGHYAADNMKQTVVPNRNMIMTSIAIGYAVSIGADVVATAVHAGDHFIYPDCRPEFFRSMNRAAKLGNEGFVGEDFSIKTPFIDWSKNMIAAYAVRLGVPIAETWSCYKGGDIHCGRCGTCVERLEALNSDEVKNINPDFVDPTPYADTEFWKEALASDAS